MGLSVRDILDLHYPTRCERRVHLRATGVEGPWSEPGYLDEIMYRRGLAHEAAHRASFPSAIDLSDGSPDDRARRTIDEVRAGAWPCQATRVMIWMRSLTPAPAMSAPVWPQGTFDGRVTSRTKPPAAFRRSAPAPDRPGIFLYEEKVLATDPPRGRVP